MTNDEPQSLSQLFNFIKSENYEMVLECLVVFSNEINHKIEGETALSLAVQLESDNDSLVEIILDAGADIEEVAGEFNSTPVILAAFTGNINVLKLLIERGGQLNKTNSDNDNALHLAAWNNQLSCVELLLTNGIDIESIGYHHRTPLLQASIKSLDTLKLLVERGAKVDAKDDHDLTALHYAAIFGQTETIEYLLSLNIIDVNSKSDKDRTALQIACKYNKLQAALALVKGGAIDINTEEGLLETSALFEDLDSAEEFERQVRLIQKLLVDSKKRKSDDEERIVKVRRS